MSLYPNAWVNYKYVGRCAGLNCISSGATAYNTERDLCRITRFRSVAKGYLAYYYGSYNLAVESIFGCRGRPVLNVAVVLNMAVCVSSLR